MREIERDLADQLTQIVRRFDAQVEADRQQEQQQVLQQQEDRLLEARLGSQLFPNWRLSQIT